MRTRQQSNLPNTCSPALLESWRLACDSLPGQVSVLGEIAACCVGWIGSNQQSARHCNACSCFPCCVLRKAFSSSPDVVIGVLSPTRLTASPLCAEFSWRFFAGITRDCCAVVALPFAVVAAGGRVLVHRHNKPHVQSTETVTRAAASAQTQLLTTRQQCLRCPQTTTSCQVHRAAAAANVS